MLKAEDMVFQRGEDGSLISQEIVLDSIKDKPVVKVKPLTRGKLMEIYQKAKTGTTQEKVEADNEIIKEGLVEPKLNDEQLKDIKPLFLSAVSTAIMAVSLGVTQKEVEEKAKDLLKEQEDELKKNL